MKVGGNFGKSLNLWGYGFVLEAGKFHTRISLRVCFNDFLTFTAS
jgi:hypothetical protein